jgi:hypothetical protein
MKIRLLLPEEILLKWSTISSMIEEALLTGQKESNLVDHMRNLMNLQTHCWLIENDKEEMQGVGLTEFIQYNRHKTLHIITVTGKDFKTWGADVHPILEQFAKDGGAIAVEQWGRSGWAKVLPKVVPGYEQAYVVMRKNIGE